MKTEIKDAELHGDDIQGFDALYQHHHQQQQPKEEIWFQDDNNNHHHHQNDAAATNLLDVGDMDVSDPSSLFYAADDFPALPDFPCMSSSSSSSSAPAPKKPFASTATSSSASTATSSSWVADHEPSSSTAVSMDLVAPPPPQQSGGGGAGGEMGSMSVDDVDQCMDMMENFGCIDLLESGDICWDPSPLFGDGDGDESRQLLEEQQLERERERVEEEERAFEEFMLQGGESDSVVNVDDVVAGGNSNLDNTSNNNSKQQEHEQQHEQQGLVSSDDLAMVFFEWLKTNKEAISAEDLRNIKIKKSTIEAAAKRLGGGKEGMKQLLKLILQWVQNHHLHNKRESSTVSNNTCGAPVALVDQDHTNSTNNNNDNNNSIIADPNPNPNPNPTPPPLEQQASTTSSCFTTPPPATWLPAPQPQPFVGDPAAMVPAPPPMVGYMGSDPYSAGMAAYPPADYHQMMDTAPHSWAQTPSMQFGMGPQYGSFPDPSHAAQFGGYPAPYPGFYYHPGPGEGLMRLGSSATKEARKKRMARQRRFFTHHHRNHNHHQNQNQNNQMNNNLMVEQHGGVGNGNCGVAPHPSPAGNWVYWSHPPPLPPQVSHPVGGPPPMVGQMQGLERAAPSGNGFQRQGGVEKKQGWKSEKNLRFLLQKVLKQSDVGNLGRIVLPKKEAETHLPELEARDGIPIAMEDIGTSRVWNMRYRFWPNNKSRMYLLENTGDFVRSNGLQEGDFIVIYSDVKCGKYMIRGVKVRPQQQGAKAETTNKKSCKTQKTQGCSSPAGNGLSPSPSSMQKLI
uniref:Transcription factor Vp1 n=1 Tax=Mesembryanthemum crystallinum TaxID=3544 RepID=O80394_MESCR|nr:transcription factor Vp1 [Mesembryanthemum crystallinum]